MVAHAAKMLYDVFISHASEDKDPFVRPLANALTHLGYRVWFDEFSLRLGDSLRRSIQAGLANARFGVVVLSPAFAAKNWPQYELDALTERELAEGKTFILPIWHDLSREDIRREFLTLAGKVAVHSTLGVIAVAKKIAEVLGSPEGIEILSREEISCAHCGQSVVAQIYRILSDGSISGGYFCRNCDHVDAWGAMTDS